MIDNTINGGKTVAGGGNPHRKAGGSAPRGKVNANVI